MSEDKTLEKICIALAYGQELSPFTAAPITRNDVHHLLDVIEKRTRRIAELEAKLAKEEAHSARLIQSNAELAEKTSSLIGKVGRLTSILRASEPEPATLQAYTLRVIELEAQLAEAKKDSERMNAIESGVSIGCSNDLWHAITLDSRFFGGYSTAREAVDAATKESEEGE